MRFLSAICAVFLAGCLAADAAAQTPLTWADVLARYKTNNPTLRAGEIGVEESRADEITAHLRPNPGFSITADQVQLSSPPGGFSRFDTMTTIASASYLFERRGKRGLRLASAQGATAIAASSQADLDRTQTFALRTAFVQLLQAKAFLALAQGQLADYDKVIALGRDRLSAGDVARIELDRLQLQRVQYESDVQTATVNVRTTKIQLIQLMNEKTPVEELDVTGPYDFAPLERPLDELRRLALETRPDLKAALQAVDKARVDYKLAAANGSTDPTLGVDFGFPKAAGSPNYIGLNLSVPLRIFDRNQGEKAKAELDITRNERLAEAVRIQAASDVDSAYATVLSSVALLRPYKDTYLDQATRVRDTVTYSYARGGAALIDLLQAQQEYRTVQIAYVNLVAAYLSAVAQLDLAVGQEVVP